MSCRQIAVSYFWLSKGLETIIQVALSGEIHGTLVRLSALFL